MSFDIRISTNWNLKYYVNNCLDHAAGPGRLNCDNGRCTDYTTEEFNCGRKIERASDSWGSLQTLPHGDDTVHSFHGFEGINTVMPAYIPNGCTLECSGCDFEGIRRDRQKNLRSNHPE
eukprot:733117_1